MSKKRYLKPSGDNRVFHPPKSLGIFRELDPDGEWVVYERYWLRKIAKGEVVECDPPKPVTKKASKRASASEKKA